MSSRKKQILLVEDEPDLLELLLDIVSGLAPQAEVVGCLNLKDAEDALAKREISLLISDRRLPDGDGAQLLPLAEKKSPPVPFVICSADRVEEIPLLQGKNLFGSVLKPDVVGPLTEILGRFAKLSQPEAADAPAATDYVRVRTQNLLKAQPLPCAVFLRVTGEKFTKLFHAGGVFEQADLEKYQKKQVDYLYVQKADFPPLMDSLARSVLAYLGSQATTAENAGDLFASSQNVLQDTVAQMGLSPAAQRLAKACAEQAAAFLSSNPQTSFYLKKLFSGQEDYMNRLSFALSATSCALVSLMPWATKEIYLKLALAAIFHDITLTRRELSRFATLEELIAEPASFTAAERAQFRSHPADSAQLVNQLESIPPDVIALVLQHHETPEGSGFPNGIKASRFSPLTAIFVLAHDFSHRFLRSNGGLPLETFMNDCRSRYGALVFSQLFKEFDAKKQKIT